MILASTGLFAPSTGFFQEHFLFKKRSRSDTIVRCSPKPNQDAFLSEKKLLVLQKNQTSEGPETKNPNGNRPKNQQKYTHFDERKSSPWSSACTLMDPRPSC